MKSHLQLFTRIGRRSLQTAGFLALALLGASACATSQPIASEEEAPLKILFITGGGAHDFETQKTILTDGIGKRLNVEFTIDHEAGRSSAAELERFRDPDWAQGYDVVLYNITLSVDQKPETAQAIIDSHVKHGVPAVLLHGSVHSYRRTGNRNWFEFIGGRSMRHEPRRPFANDVLEPDHPVMKNFPDPWEQPNGELYVIEEMIPPSQPLAHAFGKQTEKHHPTVWVNHYQGVRVFVTTIGHHNETMATDTYLDLVSCGIQWATEKES